MVREINQAGLDLIKGFEGLEDGDPTTVNLDPYMDPIGIWTIGWGHAIRVGNDFLRGKQNARRAAALYPGGLTLPQAEALLRADLLDTCRDVEAIVTATINDNQFGALVSFAYNCGVGNLTKSTLLRLVNANDFPGAAAEFGKWNKAGGQVLPGLTRRRGAEAALFMTAVDTVAPAPGAQGNAS
jgi:lysozyme